MNLQSPLLGMVSALAGSAILSYSLILQKRHGSWIDYHLGSLSGARLLSDPTTQEMTKGTRFKELLLWLLGFGLMNLRSVFVYIALYGLRPNVVAAASGSSVAFTALLSVPLLHEHISAKRFSWTLVLFVALAFLGFHGSPGSGDFSDLGLSIAFAIPVVASVVLVALRRKFDGPALAAALAGTAGAFAGFMVLAMEGLKSLPRLADWLTAPYIYMYLVCGVASFLLNQAAYRKGKMSVIAPSYYGLEVLWPAVASYGVVGAWFDPLQVISILVIAGSILMLARGDE